MRKTILTVILMISLSSAARAQFGWWASSDSAHIFNRNPGSVIISGYQALGKLTVGNDKDLYNLALVGDYSNIARNYLKIGVMPQSLDKYQGHTIFDLYHNNSEPRYAGFNFRINGTSRFFINGNGQIGIGTELPKALLDLNGGPDWNGFKKTIRLGESQALALETGGNEYGLVPTGGGISLVTSNVNSGGLGVPFSRLMSFNRQKIVIEGDLEVKGQIINSSGFQNINTVESQNVNSSNTNLTNKAPILLTGTPGGAANWTYAGNGNDIYFNTGNAGIGLTNPGAKYTIRQGTTDPGAYDDGKALFVSGNMNAGTNFDGGIEFRHDNLSQGIGFGYQSIYATGTVANQPLNIYSRGTSPLTLNAFGSGNVGIGTTSPGAKLELQGPTAPNLTALGNQVYIGKFLYTESGSNTYGLTMKSLRESTSGTWLDAGVRLAATVATNSYPIDHFYNNMSWIDFYGSGYSNALRFGTNNVERVRIDVNGNVGIGISNPDPNYKLSVNGKVKAQELYLTTTVWPDRVFDKDYVLMPLRELEESIRQEKHLPNIPSEKEVIKNGVGVVDIQAKLLQKIEELTLYVIAQNKKIDEQHEELVELKQRILNSEAGIQKSGIKN